MVFTKEDIVGYLDSDRSAEIELELAGDVIVFLDEKAKEFSELAGREVTVGDTVGLLLKWFIEESKRQDSE
jgi:hypothetical protein